MGTMGAAARRSQARNAARTKSPPAMRPRLVASQLVPPDSTSDQMTARAPKLAKTAPARSRAAPLAGASGRRSLDKAAPASPTGTFTQNTQGQPSPWVPPPPTSGPAATAKPAMDLAAGPDRHWHEHRDERTADRTSTGSTPGTSHRRPGPGGRLLCGAAAVAAGAGPG